MTALAIEKALMGNVDINDTPLTDPAWAQATWLADNLAKVKLSQRSSVLPELAQQCNALQVAVAKCTPPGENTYTIESVLSAARLI